MGKYLGATGLTYLWGKIKSIFVTKTELAGHPTGKIYYGTCSTTANTYVKEATVETFPLDENDKPLAGTVVAIKYTVTNTYKTEGQTYALNVNNTGEYPMYYNNAALATATSANTLVAGYKNRYVFYMFNGTQWVWLSASYDTNTTYSGMTQTEVDAGTGTTARLITPARLRDNFYTEDEVDTLLGSKANSNDLATVATSGSYNDLDDTPTIPSAVTESTVSGWGFTKNTGTYSKPSGGIPKSDLADAVQTSLGKADTALQSYTETDPTVPAWAKAANKPSYTASEVGALPDTTTIPDSLDDLSDDSTHRLVTDTEKSTWNGKADKVTEVNHDTSDTVFAITPNVLHKWGTIINLTLSYASSSGSDVKGYWFKFTAGNSFKNSDLVLPTGVVWAAEPNIESGKTYEVIIVDNLATYTTEGIEVAGGINISAQIGNALTATIDTIYTYASEVTALTVTLPAITNSTKAQSLSLILTTGSSPTITFSSADNTSILYYDGYSIEDATMYEINALYAGSYWIIGASKISTV